MKIYNPKLLLVTCFVSILSMHTANSSHVENDEIKRPQLIMCTIGSSDPLKLVDFYEKVFDLNFAPSFSEDKGSFHSRISSGVNFVISQKPSDQKGLMLHFHVPSIAEFGANVELAGGKKLYGPVPMPISESSSARIKSTYKELTGLRNELVTANLGQFAVYQDLEGNNIGLVELEKWSHPFYAHGKIKDKEYKEMVVVAHKEAKKFYAATK